MMSANSHMSINYTLIIWSMIYFYQSAFNLLTSMYIHLVMNQYQHKLLQCMWKKSHICKQLNKLQLILMGNASHDQFACGEQRNMFTGRVTLYTFAKPWPVAIFDMMFGRKYVVSDGPGAQNNTPVKGVCQSMSPSFEIAPCLVDTTVCFLVWNIQDKIVDGQYIYI